MRDSVIAAMDAVRSKREGLLLAQFEFLKTRQEAAEDVLAVSTWYVRLMWALSPRDFLRAVDARQTILIEKAKADMAKAVEASKAKPQLVVPTMGVACGR